MSVPNLEILRFSPKTSFNCCHVTWHITLRNVSPIISTRSFHAAELVGVFFFVSSFYSIKQHTRLIIKAFIHAPLNQPQNKFFLLDLHSLFWNTRICDKIIFLLFNLILILMAWALNYYGKKGQNPFSIWW